LAFSSVWNQLIGVTTAWVVAILGTLILLKVVDLVIELRLPAEEETEGLDLTQHGEEGYHWGTSK
jgi:ammonium transporter, Amt family